MRTTSATAVAAAAVAGTCEPSEDTEEATEDATEDAAEENAEENAEAAAVLVKEEVAAIGNAKPLHFARHEPARSLREQLAAFYAQYNPAKGAAGIERVARFYAARVPRLNAALRAEYDGADLETPPSQRGAADRRASSAPAPRTTTGRARKRKRAAPRVAAPPFAPPCDAPSRTPSPTASAPRAIEDAAAEAARDLCESPSIISDESESEAADDSASGADDAARVSNNAAARAHLASVTVRAGGSGASAAAADVVVVTRAYAHLLAALGAEHPAAAPQRRAEPRAALFRPSAAQRAQSHFSVGARTLHGVQRRIARSGGDAPRLRRLLADSVVTPQRWARATGVFSALRSGDIVEIGRDGALAAAQVLGTLPDDSNAPWRCVVVLWGAHAAPRERRGTARFVALPAREQRANAASPWDVRRVLSSCGEDALRGLAVEGGGGGAVIVARTREAAIREGAARLLREPALALLGRLPFLYALRAAAPPLPPRKLLEHARAGGCVLWRELERPLREALAAFTTHLGEDDVEWWAARCVGAALRATSEALALLAF